MPQITSYKFSCRTCTKERLPTLLNINLLAKIISYQAESPWETILGCYQPTASERADLQSISKTEPLEFLEPCRWRRTTGNGSTLDCPSFQLRRHLLFAATTPISWVRTLGGMIQWQPIPYKTLSAASHNAPSNRVPPHCSWLLIIAPRLEFGSNSNVHPRLYHIIIWRMSVRVLLSTLTHAYKCNYPVTDFHTESSDTPKAPLNF